MLLLVVVMTVLGATYIATDRPAGPAGYGDQRGSTELSAPSMSEGQGTARDGAIDGAAVYAARCAACHQPTGAGVPGAFPPLAGSEWLAGSERRLVALVLHGVSGPITVKGNSYNGAMPAFAAQLGDAELAALLSHLRATWGSGAGPVARETVAQVRQATQSRTTPFQGEAELKGFE